NGQSLFLSAKKNDLDRLPGDPVTREDAAHVEHAKILGAVWRQQGGVIARMAVQPSGCSFTLMSDKKEAPQLKAALKQALGKGSKLALTNKGKFANIEISGDPMLCTGVLMQLSVPALAAFNKRANQGGDGQ